MPFRAYICRVARVCSPIAAFWAFTRLKSVRRASAQSLPRSETRQVRGRALFRQGEGKAAFRFGCMARQDGHDQHGQVGNHLGASAGRSATGCFSMGSRSQVCGSAMLSDMNE